MAGGDKIKLFKFIQSIYRHIGLNQNRNPINAKNLLFLLCYAQMFLSSAAFLLFEANSMIEYGLAFFICTTVVLAIITHLILFWQMGNILNFTKNCERFIEKRTRSTLVYKDTNEKIERLSEYFAYVMAVTFLILLVPALLYTMVNYYLLNEGKESFFLFYPTWWPFDWKTTIGYLVAWFGQCSGSAAITIIAISFFNIVYGSSWVFVVIAEDITGGVAAFNTTVGRLRNKSDRATVLIKRFCDIIQHYSDAKQCVNSFNEICEYSLFAFFSWDMSAISSLLVTLQFQLWDDDSEPFEILILSMLTLWMFVFNLAICEPGQRVTNQFEEFDVELGRCEWNKLPIKMQRMYLTFLSDTQQSKNIRCFGGILCIRDTFKRITNKGFSYFMTLRNFRA